MNGKRQLYRSKEDPNAYKFIVYIRILYIHTLILKKRKSYYPTTTTAVQVPGVGKKTTLRGNYHIE